MRKESERGAVIVEGIISLTTFMFMMFTILSIVNICFIQSRMAVALNSAAKEISQYSYFYYKFGLDKANAKLSDGTEDSRQLADVYILEAEAQRNLAALYLNQGREHSETAAAPGTDAKARDCHSGGQDFHQNK